MIVIAGAKGGQGTTTVAASLAITAAANGRRVVLLDTGGDASYVLNRRRHTVVDRLDRVLDPAEQSPDGIDIVDVPAHRIDAAALDALSALRAAGVGVVVDAGTDPSVVRRFEAVRPRPCRVLVVRPCYLAVRRALDVPYTPDHVVLVRERLRSLTTADVEAALALPVIAVDHEPVVARAIDAGLLVSHAHRWLGRPLRHLV